MQLARWAFNIRQPLLLENIEPLVTSLTDVNDGRRVIVPVSNLLNYLPKSETDVLLQHRLEDDMRRALIARLMIHAFFTAYYDCQWDELVFDNSEGTKPVLVSPEHLKNVSFNISHHGDWAILVGETEASADGSLRLGVDVVDFQEQVPGESFETFSSCFQDQFTPKEMKFMTDASSPSRSETQLKRFYRLWCLKESMIKALDVSSDFDLKTIEFTIQDNEETEKPIHSTVIELHEPKKPELLPQEGWSFEEALLDDGHCYAIAAQSLSSSFSSSLSCDSSSLSTSSSLSMMEIEKPTPILDGSEIRRFDWKELLENAVPYPSQC